MARALPALLFLALAAALFFLPTADPVRLAALEAWPQADGEAFEAYRALGQAVLEGPAAEPSPAAAGADGEVDPGRTETVRLALAGVRIVSDQDRGDLGVHILARRAVVRGLRQVAHERGQSLEIEGEAMPAREGVEFLVEHLSADGTLGIGASYTRGLRDAGASAPEPVARPYRQPDRGSLVPPLLAILMAILFRRPVLALVVGVLSGAYLLRLGAGQAKPAALLGAFPDLVIEFFVPELLDSGRLKIVGFVFCMLAMVGVMTRSGGVRGLMDLVARLAHDARSTQFATWLMGLVVFFDDYANCILVGSTMRPLTDRFKVAREKLAYLVDSTAAPVAGISIFSTWIAFEVSTFSPQLPAAELPTSAGYQVFVETLPYRFYCLLSLFFALLLVLTRRDFGPMLAAERRARSTGKLVGEDARPMVSAHATELQPAPGVVPRAHRALLPILAFVGLTVLEILRVGLRESGTPASALLGVRGLTDVLGAGDSSRAILIGSASGLVLAVLLALGAGLRGAILSAAWATVRSMGVAVAILYLAWMIGAVCQSLGTASYLTELLGDRILAPTLPGILFLLGAAVAFSTGSSWSTMSILLPLVVGLAYTLGQDAGMPGGGHLLMVMSIGAVLEGSIFGDHCSPISDTTVLSSTAAASDHIDHVRTQAPYALCVMGAALLLGYLPCALFGLSPWLALALGAAALVAVAFGFGRRAEPAEGA